jgi:hypothetical protein
MTHPAAKNPLVALAACIALAAGLLCTAACEKQPPADPTPDQDEKAEENQKKSAMPDAIPGLDEVKGDEEDLPGSVEVLVKEKYDRGEKETYVWKKKLPAGTLQGACRFTLKKGQTFPFHRLSHWGRGEGPDPEIIKPTGPDAIKDPERGEEKYYANLELQRRYFVVRLGRKKYGYTYIPYQVVVMVHGVRAGRRPPLNRPVMMVRKGRLHAGDDSNHGGGIVQFGPVHERAQFTTWDSYPSEITVTHPATDEVFFRKTVRYVQKKKYMDKDFDEGSGHLAYRPQFITTPLLRDPGKYLVADARHPWIKGYLVVAENPYVTVTTYHKYHPRCNFKITGIPPGKHTVEVWHPMYKPVEPTFEVEIQPNGVTEKVVRFHCPED